MLASYKIQHIDEPQPRPIVYHMHTMASTASQAQSNIQEAAKRRHGHQYHILVIGFTED